MRYAALMRGINVGKAKRVAMADLRSLCEALGYQNVVTLLNSGNLLFDAPSTSPAKLAGAVKKGIFDTCAVDCAVTVISGSTLQEILAANPLAQVSSNSSHYLVGFPATDAALEAVRNLEKTNWAPDQLVVTKSAAFLWCHSNTLDSPLAQAFSKATKDTFTTRNWATLEKICAAL